VDLALLQAQAAELTSQQLAVGLLLWARLLPLVALSPWLRFRHAPASLWVVLSVVLTLCLWPTAASGAPELPRSLPGLLPLLARELAIGLVYGVCFALPLLAIAWGGELIDQLRSGGLPTADEPALSQLYAWLAVAVFFAAGGHRLVLESLATSLTGLPVGALSGFDGPLALALGSARLVGGALATALSLALPVGLALLTAELCLSLALRASSALSAFATFSGARSLLALAVVLLGLPALVQLMPGAFARGASAAAELLRAL
jgi:type III secretory pathway component EscT